MKKVIKIFLASLLFLRLPVSALEIQTTVVLPAGENQLFGAALDSVNGYAYFGTNTFPGKIKKVRLSDMEIVSTLVLNQGENFVQSAVIDSHNEFGYFGTVGPGRVVKVKLSDMSRVDSINLTGENIGKSFIQGDTGFFTCGGQFSKVVRVDLTTMRAVQTLNFPSEIQNLIPAVDGNDGHAYYGTFDRPARIIKVRLSDLSIQNTLTLSADYERLITSAIDKENGYAYFGADSFPSRVVKIRLSDFSEVNNLTFPVNENYLRGSFLTADNKFLYVGSQGKLVKIDVASMRRVDALTIGSDAPVSILGDPKNAYLGTNGSPGRIIKVNLRDPSITDIEFASSDLKVREADSIFRVEILRVGNANRAVSADYSVHATQTGEAQENVDFEPRQGTLSWPAGDSTPQWIDIRIIDDQLFEKTTFGLDEGFAINLFNAQGAEVDNSNAFHSVFILDDEKGIKFQEQTGILTKETDGTSFVPVIIERVGDTSGAVSVRFETEDFTATSGIDYGSVRASLSWAARDSTPKVIQIPVFGDTTSEATEQLWVNISLISNDGTIILGAAKIPITIEDNDVSAGTIGLAPNESLQRYEDAGDTGFSITRTAGKNGRVSVSYRFISESALINADVNAVDGTLVWEDGDDAPKTIPVHINQDSEFEDR